ncbi:MAG: hypothetical protein M3N21_00520 [Actinomycetota bacterium]|nr:hypothetical protein [Actinomycetota bacterium]
MAFTIHVTDSDGQIRSLTVDYGDGTQVSVVQRAPATCASTHRSPEPGYRAAQLDASYKRSHSYQSGGHFQAVIKVVTDRLCEAAPVESDAKSFDVTVPDFTPNPSPSPTPSASAAPTPTGSASASPTPSPSRSA